MKIAIIGPAHPYRGGIAAYNERLAHEFLHQGHEAKLHTFTLQYPSLLFPGKTQYSNEQAPEKLQISRCLNSINPFSWIATGKKIRKEKPDVVIIKYWLPFLAPAYGTLLRQIRKNKHSKIICIVDNIIPHEKRIGDKLLTTYFSKVVDSFIVMSKSVMDDIDKLGFTQKKLLSPHPLFDNFGKAIERKAALNHLGLDSEYKYILFFGLIRDYKGLDLLYKAFANPRFRDKKIKLLVAGEYYSNKEKYENLLFELKLQEHVHVVDKFIDDSDVRYYFSAANIVVQPYKSATQSGVTQIAYHFNKPMIVTDVGGLKELCPHNKVGYVCKLDENEIAKAILKYFEEEKEDEFTKNIAMEKQKFSWSIMTENIEKLLKD